MKKTTLSILFLLVSLWGFSEEQPPQKISFLLGGGFGSAFNMYASTNTDTMTGIIDTGNYSRVPLYFDIYGGIKVFDNFNAVLTIADIFERFISSSSYLQLNILQLYPSLQYLTPVKGLSASAGWGIGLLVPSTNISSYNTSLNTVEPGSVFQLSVKYQFYQVKGRLLPEAGIRLSHCELINSTITSIILFAHLSWQ